MRKSFISHFPLLRSARIAAASLPFTCGYQCGGECGGGKGDGGECSGDGGGGEVAVDVRR